MENHFPELPTMPMPATKPQKKRPKRWLLIALIVGVVLLLIGVGIVGTFLRSPSSLSSHAKGAVSTSTALQSGQPTNTVMATATSAQATSTAIAGGTHTPTTPAHTSTPITGALSATHGRPHLGGPFSDFVGKYGMPTDQGDSSDENFWVGTDQNIDIDASRSDQGQVTQLNILGPLSWNTQQAQSYCAQFLPDNAVQYNTTSTQIDYHSSSGNVVLTLQSQSCLLSIARS